MPFTLSLTLFQQLDDPIAFCTLWRKFSCYMSMSQGERSPSFLCSIYSQSQAVLVAPRFALKILDSTILSDTADWRKKTKEHCNRHVIGQFRQYSSLHTHHGSFLKTQPTFDYIGASCSGKIPGGMFLCMIFKRIGIL